ncbi:MAG: hypothetical protein GX756_00855 [Clostridiales bacterium]|nr:hypothetical protein [Clostridiales bacterium]
MSDTPNKKGIDEKGTQKFDTFREAVEQNIINKKEVPKEDKLKQNIVDSIRSFADQAKIEKLKSSAFEAQANLFVNQNTKRKMYAKINSVQKTLSYRLNDPVAVNDRLIDISTNQIYEIKSINPDKKTIKVQADDAEYEVLCREAQYELTDGKQDHTEEIKDLLNKLETSINNAKDGIVIKRKPEALRLFGIFKEKVLNNQKDEEFFNKFIDALNMLSPYLPAAVQKIIYLLDH